MYNNTTKLKGLVIKELKKANFRFKNEKVDTVSRLSLVDPFLVSDTGCIMFSGCCDATISFGKPVETYTFFATFQSSAQIEGEDRVVLSNGPITLYGR